jgi:hypothetical protein
MAEGRTLASDAPIAAQPLQKAEQRGSSRPAVKGCSGSRYRAVDQSHAERYSAMAAVKDMKAGAAAIQTEEAASQRDEGRSPMVRWPQR